MQLRIKASILFPLKGKDWIKRLLIGGAIGLAIELIFVGLTFLVSEEATFGIAPLVAVFNFPALGFILQVYRGTLRWEEGEVPAWENWPTLFRWGLVGFGIGLAYGMIPLLLVLVGLGLLVKGGVLLFLGMVLMVLGVLAGVFTLFFFPMAVARYVSQQRIEAAFHPVLVWDGINLVLAEYVAAYLLSVGSYIVAGLVAVVPYVGGVVWPVLWFYISLVQARLFGEVCARAI